MTSEQQVNILEFSEDTIDVTWQDTFSFVLDVVGDEELNTYFETFAYQGFDPRMIRKLALQYSNNDLKPIIQLISLSLRQGTRVGRFDDTLSNDGKAIFRALMNKFKLSVIDGSRRRVPRYVLTIQRLQAAFPDIVAIIVLLMWKKHKFVPVGATEDLMVNTPWLYFPSAGALIPKSETALLSQWRSWNKNFSRIINRRRRDTDLTAQSDFEEIIFESPLFSEEERVQIVRKLMELERNL